MNRVLSYDKFKLQKSKYWWICTLIAIAMNTIGIIVLKNGMKYLGGSKSLPFDAYRSITSPVTFLLAIIICLFVGTDFKTGTIKNIASKGIHRHEIVLSKLIRSYILSFIFITLSVLAGIVTIILLTNTSIKGKEFAELIKLTAISFVAVCAFSSLFNLISFTFKSSGISMAISIIFIMLSEIVISLLEVLLKIKNLKIYFPNFISTITVSGVSSKTITTFIISMIVWTVVCSGLTILIFKKQEIK